MEVLLSMSISSLNQADPLWRRIACLTASNAFLANRGNVCAVWLKRDRGVDNMKNNNASEMSNPKIPIDTFCQRESWMRRTPELISAIVIRCNLSEVLPDTGS